MKPYYQDSAVTIYHGDFREVLPMLKPDIVVSDPPYGINYKTNWNREQDRPRSIQGDESTALRDEMMSLADGLPMILFGSWKSPRPRLTQLLLTWEKLGSSGMGDLSAPWRPNTEEIYIIGDGFLPLLGRESSVLRFNALCGVQLHPNEKPENLMRYLVERCPSGEVVDPFMGSGPTLRAAKDLNRKAIGIELEERYCEIAANRMSQEVLALN